MSGVPADWRLVDGVPSAWFDAPSLTAGAALAERVLGQSSGILVDLRSTGLRVRLDDDTHAVAVSAAARDLGLAADPAALQQVRVVLESPDPSAAAAFWRRVLDYAPGEGGALTDPLRRDADLSIRPAIELRPLRNRLHLDVVRPAAVVESMALGQASGPYGVRYADPDGNEVDVVPGDALGEQAATADWHVVFGARACYRTTSPEHQRALAVAAATLADEAGFPLLVDLRPGLVILDSGKDQWEADAHGLDADVTALAASIQTTARELGAAPDAGLPRFVQLFLDAADVTTVRAFWAAALGYVPDRRAGVTDLYDPRRLDPVLVFQQLDLSEADRRRQRNRSHVELAVPSEVVPARLDAAVAAGGRLLEESAGRWQLSDPEGNELVIRAGDPRG